MEATSAPNVALYDPGFQIDGNLELSLEENAFGTGASHPTLVIRAGILSPGRSYTFSMTATDLVGSSGYSGMFRMLLTLLH